MEKMVIFRDRQETTPDDVNNIEQFTRDSIDHVVSDAITTDLAYVGFGVTVENSTSIRVAVGRVYQGGKVYVAESSTVFQLSTRLPSLNQKILSVYAFGQPIQTDVEERNFVIDVNAVPMVAEPQAVPMLDLRQGQVNFVVGIESVNPQPAALPANSVLVATVVLTTTGVGTITRNTADVLPSIATHEITLADLGTWRTLTSAKVDALTSDQAALWAKTQGTAKLVDLVQTQVDVSKVKRLLNLPTAGAAYDTDLYADSSKIDQTVSVVDTDYRITSRGAGFAYASSGLAPIALFNPYDPNAYRSTTDLVLPLFDEVVAVKTDGYVGEFNISQFQVQTTTTVQMTGYKTETRYR